jgi:hypothetical protein
MIHSVHFYLRQHGLFEVLFIVLLSKPLQVGTIWKRYVIEYSVGLQLTVESNLATDEYQLSTAIGDEYYYNRIIATSSQFYDKVLVVKLFLESHSRIFS